MVAQAETYETERDQMVQRQMAARGVEDEAVLAAMRSVPRHAFVGEDLQEFAYADTPLPIEEEQTISQPYIVALMTEALELEPEDKVLEIGTGSGYAAAILSRIVDEVFTVERHGNLAHRARERYRQLGYDNIHVRHGDGSQGWPEHAPYDAIVVAAGGPKIPEPLQEQLAVGGRLVMPVGELPRLQRLIRLRRVADDEYVEEDLGYVQFVPLVGSAAWSEKEAGSRPAAPAPTVPAREQTVPELITATAEPFTTVSEANLDRMLERIGDARVVLLGESTHGTAEFYEMRAQITRALIEEKGFNVVALEADWPDAAQVDAMVRNLPREGAESPTAPFTRFPTWMWANEQFGDFVRWLQQYNESFSQIEEAVGTYGLDLYSLYRSIDLVLDYLEDVDPDTAAVARQRYGCLSPWEGDPATYGIAALTGEYEACETDVVATLQELLNKSLQYTMRDGRRFFNAAQNARVVANAERYYRVMYYGSPHSWNLRDEHMFDTLQSLLAFRGPDSRAVVWAHNSHLGNAAATEMGARGQHNLGQLSRAEWGDDAYLVGFGTDHGEVLAASEWGDEGQVQQIRPAHEHSYEALCHQAEPQNFFLPLRLDRESMLNKRLMNERLERAIGVVYRPRTEIQSHYFRAVLPRQFDEYIWFDETTAVTPVKEAGDADRVPRTFPFGV